MARPAGLALRGWLALSWLLQPLLPRHLKKRLKRGKEHPTRWREKLGHPSAARPDGQLIWMHAVGLGEALALRGLIARMQAQTKGLNFLVTSSTRASAEVFTRNLPPNTIHQFAPLDAPGPARRFLAHWQPDLSIWAEQELWPGLVYRTDRAAIPLALVNARMNDAAFERRARGAALYRDILPRFALISAQDAKTADHLATLGAPMVQTHGSLKPASPALTDAPADRAALMDTLNARPVWLAASTHPEDEALCIAAHATLLQTRPDALLVLVPRLPERAADILTTLQSADLTTARHSTNEPITSETQIYLADTFGELGLFYRLAHAAFIGGTMNDTEGHNPWEAARLGCAILHGPRTANFAADYAALDAANAAQLADQPDTLAAALTDPALVGQTANATALLDAHMDRIDQLCHKLTDLI
ncbi:3-deoxy-D-manno-octulosonic acid transferase [Rhodobacteraceae bacterium D3-12]|nr:3-deoxy-D-manno-octulosonic acid transferase [Rhodobacteraceae bacterium D3-12]